MSSKDVIQKSVCLVMLVFFLVGCGTSQATQTPLPVATTSLSQHKPRLSRQKPHLSQQKLRSSHPRQSRPNGDGLMCHISPMASHFMSSMFICLQMGMGRSQQYWQFTVEVSWHSTNRDIICLLNTSTS